MKPKNVFFIFSAFCFFTTAAFADNHTVTGVFDGGESLMSAATGSCDSDAKRYREAGTISVSASGTYRVVDAGNWFPSYRPDSGVADIVIVFYAGSFNPGSPSSNRVASVDEYEDVQLTAGISYILVVQHWCEEINGPYAILVEGGPGTVSGDGFPSPAQTIGNFDAGSPSANFADVDATLHYRADEKTVSETSRFFWVDLWEETAGTELLLRIYKGSFDPQNTDANLVYNSYNSEFSSGDWIGSFQLLAGVKYVFVLIDTLGNFEHMQYVLFPSSVGPASFNPGLNGTWVSPGVEAQGILMDVTTSFNLVFFAHFTYQDGAVVAAARSGDSRLQSSGAGDAAVQADIGADDQRWLTGYGSIPASGNMLSLKYENSTGGRFNAETPAATTNSNYGTGYIEILSCDHMIVNWNLPGGVDSTREYYKASQDMVSYCLDFIPAGAVSPDW